LACHHEEITRVHFGRVIIAAAAALLLGACQTGGPSILARQSPSASLLTTTGATAPTTPSPGSAQRHVFVIVLENTSSSLALAQPYIGSIASQYGVATNYHDVGNPSLPNYLAMTSGSTWGIHDDGYHRLPANGLGDQLTGAGISWKAYFEGFTGDCFNSPYPYALKHNPFAYYGGQCPSNVVPMTQLSADLAGNTPQLSWITPGLCNDGHDCGIRTADQWLAQTVPQITGSAAWQQDGVLLITWDESSAGDSRVGLLVLAPNVHQQQFATAMAHYSLLATVEDLLGQPRLGAAAGAPSLAGALKPAHTTANAAG
jgi:phosphatidylinositol-3-phosphatase